MLSAITFRVALVRYARGSRLYICSASKRHIYSSPSHEMNKMKRIDGSTLEGGGQILRDAVALAALLRQPVMVENIRKGRKVPGLTAGHAAGVNLVGQISKDSVLVGAFNESQTLEFTPGIINSGSYSADPGTAGATTLLLQVALPCLLFSPSPAPEVSTLQLHGGTNAIHVPQIDYTQKIFLPFLHKHFGVDLDLNIIRRGYYPKGGGEIALKIQSRNEPLPAITLLERGEVISIHGRAYASGLSIELAKTCRDAAVTFLTKKGIDPSIIDIEYLREHPAKAIGTGSGIVLWAETEEGCLIGGSSIGQKCVEAEELGREAAEELWRNLKTSGCVDEYLQDQWIIFGALAQGKSRVRCGLPLTLHTRTSMWLAEELTGVNFSEIPGEDGTTVVLECEGIGYTPRNMVEEVNRSIETRQQ